MSRGKFIVIEGIDGSGKTTQINMLKEKFKDDDKWFFTAEPTTDTEYGLHVRNLLSDSTVSNAEMAAAFLLDRIHHCKQIKEYLDKGINVICDRYYYSNIAYQGYDEYRGWVWDINENCHEILIPDCVILLNLTPEKALERINAGRNVEDLEKYENLQKLTNVHDEYLNIWHELNPECFDKYKHMTVVMLPADRKPMEVFKWICSVLKDVTEE